MDKQNHECTVYAPIYTGKREVVCINVKKVRITPDRKIVFINDQHYMDVFRTKEDAEDYWTRCRNVTPMSNDEIMALV